VRIVVTVNLECRAIARFQWH